jgi:glyoxylase-like metal-dependent hydrolase (beta-lactamase superfamily II)
MSFIRNLILSMVFISIPAYAHEVKIPKSLDELTSTKIAENVYVIHGVNAMPNKANQGFMSNSAFVVSDQGVVIIDTGGSLKYGQYLVKTIKAVTKKPVVAVFNTHMHGDHWLGNAAIRKAFPKAKIYAHPKAIERLKNGEAKQWLFSFTQLIGRDVTGANAVMPDHAVNDGDTVKLAGRTYHIHHKAKAHTDNDILIEYPTSKILFAGDVVVYDSVPSGGRPEDFSIKGSIKALNHALTLPIDIYVPGHGPTGNREIPEATKRFLDIFYSSVKKYYNQGMQDFEMRDKVIADLAEFKHWRGMDGIGRNINFVYRQIEAEDFE